MLLDSEVPRRCAPRDDRWNHWTLCLVSVALVLAGARAVAAAPRIETHEVESEYQNGKQVIRVILPDNYDANRKYRTLYLLPVAKGFGKQDDVAMDIIVRTGVHNRHDLIVVQMGFEREPWFGDHVSDKRVRQASYVKDFLVPYIETHYSTTGTTEGRLLLGFSKSGWGAFSLILKYPETFGYAASWDAPLMFREFHYGMAAVYGTAEQLAVFRPDLLAKSGAAPFREKTRLVLAGEKAWGAMIPPPDGKSHTAAYHALLERNAIKHVYLDKLDTPHRWDEKWLVPLVDELAKLSSADSGDTDRATPNTVR
jgi:enterochelin esterase-like enzyme